MCQYEKTGSHTYRATKVSKMWRLFNDRSRIIIVCVLVGLA